MNLLEATALLLAGKLKTEDYDDHYPDYLRSDYENNSSYYHWLWRHTDEEAEEAYRRLVREHPADIHPRGDDPECEVFDYKDGLVIELHPETLSDEKTDSYKHDDIIEVDYVIFDSEEDRQNGYDWNILVNFDNILEPEKYWNTVKEWAVKARADWQQREREEAEQE